MRKKNLSLQTEKELVDTKTLLHESSKKLRTVMEENDELLTQVEQQKQKLANLENTLYEFGEPLDRLENLSGGQTGYMLNKKIIISLTKLDGYTNTAKFVVNGSSKLFSFVNGQGEFFTLNGKRYFIQLASVNHGECGYLSANFAIYSDGNNPEVS